VVIHYEEALYQVYAPLPLSYYGGLEFECLDQFRRHHKTVVRDQKQPAIDFKYPTIALPVHYGTLMKFLWR